MRGLRGRQSGRGRGGKEIKMRRLTGERKKKRGDGAE